MQFEKISHLKLLESKQKNHINSQKLFQIEIEVKPSSFKANHL